MFTLTRLLQMAAVPIIFVGALFIFGTIGPADQGDVIFLNPVAPTVESDDNIVTIRQPAVSPEIWAAIDSGSLHTIHRGPLQPAIVDDRMAEALADLAAAAEEAEACRKMIDKPLRCLP